MLISVLLIKKSSVWLFGTENRKPDLLRCCNRVHNSLGQMADRSIIKSPPPYNQCCWADTCPSRPVRRFTTLISGGGGEITTNLHLSHNLCTRLWSGIPREIRNRFFLLNSLYTLNVFGNNVQYFVAFFYH